VEIKIVTYSRLRKFAVLVAVAVFSCCAAAQPAAAPAPTQEAKILFDQVDPILQGLSEITGWKIKRKTPAEYISRVQLRAYIEKRVKEVLKPEELRVETIALKMFGLVPEDFNLEKMLIELMTEQAAAFYDYDRKRLYITEAPTSFLEKRIALVHELAHAIADQHFPLGKYIRGGGENDDGATAREAVMEGQATWLMWAYVSKLGGGDAEVSDIILQTATASPSVDSRFPVFEKAPLYVRESLMFPYTRGLLFQNAVYKKLGQEAFSEVFRRAPVSSQQILHPQLYFNNTLPSKPEPPDPPDLKAYRLATQGAVGEFDHQVLIHQYGSEQQAADMAPHWRGGWFRLFEAKSDARPVLAYASDWDSPQMASRVFSLYRQVMRKKSKRIEIKQNTESLFAGANERGSFVVRLDGARVSSLEGLPEVD
jgi:hypothetical protein